MLAAPVAADAAFGTVASWTVAAIVTAALIFGRSPVGLLNFVVLQWFGVRLAHMRQRVLFGDGPECFRHVRWSLLRWVWPLTGWWSPYRWIARRP